MFHRQWLVQSKSGPEWGRFRFESARADVVWISGGRRGGAIGRCRP